uniref:Uncharacterized protein n=1 Tax=Strombidinopsis acuminata TaxID=141414 RepID=A0A7S3SAX5_9SPIT
MGAKPSVKLTTDAPSTAEKGQKVVTSEPLEVDGLALMEELLQQARYPVDSLKGHVLKSCDVQENGPDDFTVKVILDGKKLDRYKSGRGDGMDRIDHWMRVVADRKNRRIQQTSFVDLQGCWVDEVEQARSKGGYGCTELVGSPMRVEFHIIQADGSRQTDEEAAALLDTILTDALTNMEKRKAKVMAEQDSLQGDGQKSVISEPLDEHIDFDSFWEKFLDMVKNPPNAPAKVKVTDVSKEEFLSEIVVPDSKTTMTTKVKHNKAAGEVITETLQDGERVSGSTVLLHRNPLRVETWGVDSEGKRLAGRGTARGLQEYVDTVLAKKSHHRSWFR